MKKTLFLVPLLFSLSAFTCQERPKPIIHNVYCVTPEQYARIKDAEPDTISGQLTGQAQQDFITSASQNILLRQYADGLLQVIGGCIGPAPSPA